MARRTNAFTYVDLLMLIIVLAIGAAIVLPMLARSRIPASRINCTANLKQVGLAFKTWAIDQDDRLPMEIARTNGVGSSTSNWLAYIYFAPISNELSTPKVLICPSDTTRIAATNFNSDLNNQRLSYFVNLDSTDSGPEQILSGDRNLVAEGETPRRLLILKTNSAVSWTTSIHMNNGNLLLTDGSVQQVSTKRLREFFINLPEAGARLAMP